MARKLVANQDNTSTSSQTEPLTRAVARPIFGENVLAIDYNFAEKGILDDDITFSRASGATQTNSEGKVAFAPHNLLIRSERMHEWSQYTYNGGSQTWTDNHTDPNGGTNAQKVVGANTDPSAGGWLNTREFTAVSGAHYILSVWMKGVVGGEKVRIDLRNGSSAGVTGETFTLTTEWKRYTQVITSDASATRGFQFRQDSSLSVHDFFVYGAQAEQTIDSSATSAGTYNYTNNSAYNGPRFDYTKDGDKKGLLIEEARTNLLTQSDTNTYFGGVSNTFDRLNNHSISPSGAKDAAKFISTAPNALKVIQSPATPVVGTSTTFTFSAYIKRGNTDYVRMYHNDSTSFGVTFNLATGQVHSNDATANGSHFIEEVGNGWYRCGYSHTTPSGHSLGGPYIYPTDTNNTITHANQWSVILWQPQVELGSFPTSLIPTYGATASRSADIATISGTAFSRFFKDTEGTIVVDVQEPKGWKDTDYNRLYSFNDTSHQNRITAWLDVGSGQEPRGQIVSGNTNQGSIVAKSINLNTGEITRVGQSYATDRHYTTADSSAGNFDGTVTLPTGLNTLNIGSGYSGVAPFGGWIRRLRYFNKRKTNAQVQNLTDTSFLLDKFKGAKAAHSLRSLRDGRDNSPVTRIRREYDSFEADYTAAQVSNGELENDFKSEKQTTLPLDVSVEADELVTNGTFDSNTTGWGAGGGATLAVDNGRLKITNGASGNSYANQTLTTKVGSQYTVSLDYTDDTGGNALIWAGTSFGGSQLGTKTFTTSGHYTFTFTATTATSYLRIGANEATNGTIYFFDNVSVKEVNPIATGFSTRKINSDYTGYGPMRIRNNDDQVEAELGWDSNNQISLDSPVKPTSMNLIASSEDFGTNWTLQTCTIEKYSGLDPFGGYNATKITATGGASSGPYYDASSSVTSGKHYTLSVYIKAEEATRTRVGWFRNASNWVNVQTDWSASGIPTTHATDNASNIKYEAIGSDGWYRVSLVGITDSLTSVNLDPDSGGNNKSAIFFGAMLEETVYESTGTEKMTNGDFSNGSTGWTLSPFGQTVEVQNEALRIATPDGTFCKAEQVIHTTPGKKYTTTLDLTVISGGLSIVAGSQTNHTSSGTISVDRIATGSSFTWTAKRFNTSGANDVIIDNISVKEYDPIVSDYVQTPVISDAHNSTSATNLREFAGKENLLTYSEGAFASNWGNAATATDNTHPNPIDGALTASTLKSTSGIQHRTISVTLPTAGSYVFSVYLKKKTGSASVGIGDFTDGTITQTVTDEWQRFSKTTTFSAGTHTFTIRVGDTNEEVFVWGAQVNTNSLKDYQKTSGSAKTADVHVVNWYDQGGGEDFTQSTTGEQPRIVMGSELVTSNGKASVYFDGGDTLDNNTLAGQNRLDSYFIQDTSDNKYVYPTDPNSHSHYGLVAEDGSTSTTLALDFGTPSYYVNGALQSFSDRDDVHDALTGKISLVSQHNTSTSDFGSLEVGQFSVDPSYNYTGKISEMVFFPNMDSSPKRFPIEQNMLRHFDVNLVTNGTFDTNSNWTGTGSSISNGKLTINVTGGAYSFAYQPLSIYETGKTYKVSFTVNGTSGKQIRARDDSGNSGGLNLTNGIISLDGTDQNIELIFTATAGSDEIIFERHSGSGDWSFTVDNVKLQEYGTSGFVTTLYDQTGNNCHATQSTAAYQPQIVSGGDLIKSGNHPAWYYNVSNPQRNLAVQGMENLTTLDAFFVHETGSDQQFIYPSSNNSSYFGFIAHNGSTQSATTVNYGSPILEVNGVEKSPSDRDDVYDEIAGRKLVYHRSASTTTWTGFNVGFFDNSTNNSWNLEDIKFSEMVFWDSDQHSNQSGIESNINTHYNIY